MDNWTGFAICASKASDAAKRRFQLGRKAEIALLILAALAQVLPVDWFPAVNTLWVSVAAAGGAIIIALLVRAIRIEEIWQETRTLSESSKKLMWLYILGAAPFSGPAFSADSEFLLALEKLREQAKVSKDYMAAHGDGQDLITQWMRDERNRVWADRSKLYMNERIIPEIDWYTTRASQNSRGEAMVFCGTMGLELVALVAAVLILEGSVKNGAWLGVFTTMAAGMHAWGKFNRHQQLADAYSVIAQQLRGQKALWVHIGTEVGLIAEVEKTEELISRENTNWAVVRS